jgi:hypothetical protein
MVQSLSRRELRRADPCGNVAQARKQTMNENESVPTVKGMFWTGVVMSVIPTLMLLMGSVMALTKSPQALQGMAQFGYPEHCITAIGAACLVSTLLYIIPRTAVLGAILLTGYLGGAVATHVRVEAEKFTFLMPVVFGALIWGGLFFRDARIRKLLPWRK